MSQEGKDESTDLLQILEAQVESLRGRPDAALGRLEGRVDPASVRRRVAILIDAGKPEAATDEIRKLEISESWADLAAFAYGSKGELGNAKLVVDWAKAHDNLTLTHRASVLFVDGLMRWTFREKPQDSIIVPGSITDEEREILVEIASTIGPVCDAIAARHSVDTEVESQLLQRYFDISYLLGDRSRVTQLFNLLVARRPIPIKIGQAVLQGLGKASLDIVSRLWEEHPDSFRAQLLSCVVAARDLNDVTTAEERAFGLAAKAKTKLEREELCELIYELSDSGNRGFERVEKFVSELLGPDSFLLTLFKADQLIQAGKHQDALALLEKERNEADPRWLRSFANAKVTAGDSVEALDLLKRLSAVVPSPDVFRAIVKLSEEQGRFDDQREALEQTLALDPGNLSARWRLAMLFAKGKQYVEAAKHFEILRAIKPEDEAVHVNLAVSYSFAGDTDRALAVLVPKAGEDMLPLSLLKIRVQILESTGRVDDAFQELAKGKDIHWEEPAYLLGYMKLGYASGREKEAHKALAKLQELHERGVVDEQLMRPASLDDVRQLIEAGVKRADELRRLTLQGKVPWITAAQIQREVPLWSWLLKTQPLNWIWDEPLNRATYAVYATNSYRLFQQGELLATLEEVSCPNRGTPIVVDLSALITLHALGLFTRAVDYFGTVYVPAVYLSKVVDDATQLLPHQKSRKQAAGDIIAAVREGKLTILNTTVDSQPGFARVDEYSDDVASSHDLFRLKDLFATLHEAGLIDDEELKEASSVAHKEGSQNPQKAFVIGGRIVIGELTLETLHGLGLLGTLTREFSVHIAKADYDDIAARVRAFEALEEARTKYNALWTALKSDKRVRFAAAKKELGEDKERPDGFDMALAGMFLAKEKTLPLLCDDRVIQAVTLNEHREDRIAAFGTDSIINKLFKESELSAIEAAKLVLRLMEWRYRFLVMSPELMKALADQYRAHPPGNSLRQVAKYVHDCMRDPGLFAGLEPTNPPVSIAVRLYQTWTQNISELLMDLWGAADVSESYAEEFTKWALTEFLPSPPRVLDERMQAVISSLTPLTVFTRALIRGSDTTQFARINRGLRSIASALGMDEKEYVSIVVKVIRGTNK